MKRALYDTSILIEPFKKTKKNEDSYKKVTLTIIKDVQPLIANIYQ